MSGRKLSKSYQLLSVASTGSGGPFTSPNIDAVLFDNVGIQCIWTGTAAGSFTVNGGIIENPATGAIVWTPLNVEDQAGNPPVASGAPGNLIIRLTQVPYPFLQVVYTEAAGSGALVVNLSAKMI